MDCPKKENASDILALWRSLLQRSNSPGDTPRSSKYAAKREQSAQLSPFRRASTVGVHFKQRSWNLLMQQVTVKDNVSRKVHCHEIRRNQSWVYSTIVFNTVWKQGSHRTKAKRVQEAITISPSYESTTTLALPLKTPTTTTTAKITYQKHKSRSSWTSLRVYQTASLDYYSFSDSNL